MGGSIADRDEGITKFYFTLVSIKFYDSDATARETPLHASHHHRGTSLAASPFRRHAADGPRAARSGSAVPSGGAIGNPFVMR
jgi:hypothetical protein